MSVARAPRRARPRSRRGALAGGVLLALVASGLAVGAPPATAQAQDGSECLPAGGVDQPFTTQETDENGAPLDPQDWDLIVNGGGFGHGVGMSQYGAQGAALAGCSHATILSTYYPGTSLVTRESPPVVRVGLRQTTELHHTYRITAESAGGRDVVWELCDRPAETCTEVERQDADVAAELEWTVVVDPPAGSGGAGQWVLKQGAAEVWRGGDVVADRLRARHDGTVTRIVETPSGCNGKPGFCVKWGFTEFDYEADGRTYVVQHVTPGPGPDGQPHSAVDRYLWGLSEIPLRWQQQAHRAQAVAGRSYAHRTIATRRDIYDSPERPYDLYGHPGCRCDLFPTTVDQFWTGWEHERVDAQYGDTWRAAVGATAGQVLVYDHDDDGLPEVASTFYSSSHGGFSESVAHVWGASIDYLNAVDTSRWECLSGNPYQRWSRGFTMGELATRFGLAEVDELEIVSRGPGGRPTLRDLNDDGHPDGAVVRGTDAQGAAVERWYSGEQLRSKLRKGIVGSALMYLDWVEPEPEPTPSPSVSASPSPSPTSSPSSSPSPSPSPSASPSPSPSPSASPSADEPCHAAAGTPPLPERVAGETRIQTAAAVARLGWDTSETVVVARSNHPADALAGSALAGRLGAPLLVNPPETLHADVAAVVDELGATTAVLLGGEAALSAEVAQRLLDETGIESIDRVAGEDRFLTATAIADRLAPEAGGAAFLVRGRNVEFPEREWPDALAVSGLAAHRAVEGRPWPILLTGEELPAATVEALERHGVTQVHVVGGSAVVPDAVVADLEERGYQTQRIAGEDRWGTSRDVLGFEITTDEHVLLLATGRDFPDGLAAGPLAARLGARLLLVPAVLDPERSPWLEGQHPDAVSALGWTDGRVIALGGSAAIEDAVAQAIRDAMG